MTQHFVDAANERILLRLRADLLRDVVSQEALLDRAYRRKLDILRRQLKGSGAVSPTIRKAMKALSKELEPIVEDMLNRGVLKGDKAAREQFQKLFGDEATGIKFRTTAQQLAVAGARIRGTLTVDRVKLSRRLWVANRQAGDRMAMQIAASVKAGKSMIQVADELIGLDAVDFAKTPPRIKMPQYVQRLEGAARRAAESGQPNLYQDAAKRFTKQTDKLSQAGGGYANSMRPVAKQLRKELQGAGPAQIDKHVERFMLDKARVHARMIARSETVEAYRDSYRASTEGQEFTKGYRWTLGARHPEFDECDGLAGQDLHGLGPGGYPVSSVPPTPHPLDMCLQTAILDQQHFKRKLAERKGTKPPPKPWKSGKKETSADWYRKQSEPTRQKILGPTRAEVFKTNPNAVLGKDGVPRPVRDVLRRQKE